MDIIPPQPTEMELRPSISSTMAFEKIKKLSKRQAFYCCRSINIIQNCMNDLITII